MYSVMIVDDEPIIRMGLEKTVKWEEYGFKVECVCTDGEEALEQLKRQKIHFIITDIKMHKLSGIELLRNLRNMELDTVVVLLSGYDEFSYAQEGLRLGAFDYILKPLDREKLENVLVAVHKKLVESDKKNYEFNINKTISKEKVLYDLLRGKNLMEMDEYILKYNLPIIKNKVQVAIVEINDIVINSEELIGNDKGDYLEKSVVCIIEKELKNNGVIHFSIIDGELGMKFIIAQAENIESTDFDHIFSDALRSILKTSNEKFEIEINIGIGKVYNHIYSLYKSYLNAKEALNYKYILGTNKLIHFNELNQGYNVVQKAREYVLNHVEEEITLTSISNHLNISKNYFCSVFKQQTGENFLEYLTKAKMDRAKILLKRYDYKVYEISDILGYKETAYFSKLFKKHTGYTPAKYKKNSKNFL
ncbi:MULTISPECIES: response regulator [Clostridium]|uniref:Stage 0 sporulation protein A homolog n=1 Tax=Clostridium cibarium TaxID=2762247 RepID=A0ABR8PST6_9CLOT|nr:MULTISPECIES: response regulator [Clostridium]MBD7911213.1 response regulator [Clostridium cibarium]